MRFEQREIRRVVLRFALRLRYSGARSGFPTGYRGEASDGLGSCTKRTKVDLPPQVKLAKDMIGTRSLLRTSGGWLIGFDAGEFGGGLWWFSRDGHDSKKLLSENVHAIYETSDGIFVLAGLAHLSMDNGEIDRFVDTPESVSVKYIVSLGGSPEASTVAPNGQIVVATTHSVLLVDGGKVRDLYKSGERLVYPTSTVVDGEGNIFVAMRFFVLRLSPRNGTYESQWLIPNKCRSVKVVRYECACRGTN
jgi:hypothetical protein